MHIKEHSFISMLVFLPIMLFFSILLLLGEVSGDIYIALFTISFVTFWISFIFTLFFAIDEIINSDNRKRLLYLMIVPFFYLPIYYTKYVKSESNNFGIAPMLMNIILIIGLCLSVKNYTYDYMSTKYNGINTSFFTYK